MTDEPDESGERAVDSLDGSSGERGRAIVDQGSPIGPGACVAGGPDHLDGPGAGGADAQSKLDGPGVLATDGPSAHVVGGPGNLGEPGVGATAHVP